MFADFELAARIERAEAHLSVDIAGVAPVAVSGPGPFVEEVGGGFAVYAGARSPVNKVIGAGFAGPPDASRLEAVETLFAARRSPIQAEVSTLADPSWHECLGSRGYLLAGFENVLGLSLIGDSEACDAPATHRPVRPTTEAITVVQCSSARDDQVWLDVLASGFEQPDAVPAAAADQDYPRAAIEETFRAFFRAPGFSRYIAFLGETVVGGATLRQFERVAALCGAATLPGFRRRGVQTALVRYRLAEARRRGCDIAVVTTAPGSRSQQNAERHGFGLLYTRALHLRRS